MTEGVCSILISPNSLQRSGRDSKLWKPFRSRRCQNICRDNDVIYGKQFRERVGRLGLKEKRTSVCSPWQSPYVERLIGTIRRECLDHFIIFNKAHLHRILTRYFEYYHRVRPHKSLAGDSPDGRPIEDDGKIISMPILGGLHHHYHRNAA